MALPQIGISKAGFVAYFFDRRNIIKNPVIVKKTKTIVKSEEECFSIPWYKWVVDRHHSIIAKYDGSEWTRIPVPGSIVFQHEYDHLCWTLLTHKK